MIYCFKAFSRSVELEYTMGNEIRLNKYIETPSRCGFSLMQMIVRNGKRTELPRWPFTYHVNSLTASANDNVKVRMALPIAMETVGIVNDADLKNLRCKRLVSC